ncbi:hypothetical protein [Streptomyces sp. TRM70350]|uniref:hypothetical protein n=1 Tax=Streptomyces sp. TRM70350 TaxID=2856165 RepID=UPI001C4397F8|nr:hypothetical protein [Streptomyces sp. TRM70350]MBV7700724.1 hypothetical protein [Streptomyces sp. TRM70350]
MGDVVGASRAAQVAAHRSDARRRSRKAIQCAVGLLAFCVVPLAGLAVHWIAGETATGLIVLAEAAIVIGLGRQVVSFARPLR